MSEQAERRYRVQADEAYAALGEVISQCRYKLTAHDSSARSMSFNTGLSLFSWSGQNVSAVVDDGGDGTSRVTLNAGIAKTGLSRFQLTSMGETRRVAAKVLRMLDGRIESAD
jgi:hypothetical protein